MADFQVTILGNGAAVPTTFQNPSAQILQFGHRRFLIDCGEGTQLQMLKYHVSRKNLSHIFISHLHGDHYLGLIGLISTMHLYGREAPLHIYGPPSLKEILELMLQHSETHLRFTLSFHVLGDAEMIYDDGKLEISSFPLNHRIPTWGFVFREKEKERNLRKEFVARYAPGVEQMHQIKQGGDFVLPDGNSIKNKEITIDPPLPRSYAYCSDTAYDRKIIPFIRSVDLLFHEATFDDAMTEIAAQKFHSTARQAAMIAAEADVGRLLLGHFSARFSDNSHLLKEAKEVFENTLLSEQGNTYPVGDKE